MLTSGRMKSSQKAGPPPCFFYALTSSLGSFERQHRTHISSSSRPHQAHISCSGRPHHIHISCSGRALCRPRTKPHPNRRDVRACVRTDEPPNRMRSWHTFINITLIIFRLSFGCEAGTRHGHYFWKPKKVLLKTLLCDFLNHLINREL